MNNFLFKASHPSPKGSVDRKRRRKLILTYASDWVITIGLAAAFFALDSVEGYRRKFSLDDLTLHYPYAVHERIPNVALYLIAILAPFIIMLIVNFITVRSWWDFHNGTLGLILGLALTGAFTQIVKITVGRPRPDFLSRCQPPEGLTDPPYGLTDWTICRQTDNAIMRDGFRSFFSGHSSLSFAGLGFLSFYLAGKLHLFDSRGHAGKSWLALSPFMAATLVAISRTMDYRHHWHDVLIGSLVGTVLAYFSYRQYYPSLASSLSHRPYSPRIGGNEKNQNGILPTHHQHQPGVNGATPLNGPMHKCSGSIDESDELEGTVPRPGPQHLEDAWKERTSTDDLSRIDDRRGLRSGSVPTTESPETLVAPRG